MRILVSGLGGIGRRHLRNLLSLRPDAEYILQSRRSDAEVVRGLGFPTPTRATFVTTVEQALQAKPDVAIICTPASCHMTDALLLAKNGTALFIEKPIADSAEGAVELIDYCARNAVCLMVGYCLRFQPALAALQEVVSSGRIGRVLRIQADYGRHLTEWRPDRDYRTCASVHRHLGGGVLRELSHEIDYVRWIGGEVESVWARTDKLSDLEMDAEDTAILVMRLRSGASAVVTLDCWRNPASRTCSVFGTEGTAQWDGIRNESRIATASADWESIEGRPGGDDMYVRELRAFFQAVESGGQPAVAGPDALATLNVVLAAERSAANGQRIVL